MSSLGQLAAGMAHEINNPITFIHSNIEHIRTYTQTLFDLIEQLLALPSLPPHIEDYLHQVEFDFIRQDFPDLLQSLQHGVERINSLMLSLRMFSRLQESQLKHADLHDGISSTLKLLKHRLSAQAHRPEICVTLQLGDLPLVECYSSQINQVFMNILTNAIDAIDDRWFHAPNHTTPSITIQTTCPSASHVQISISNNGSTIPPGCGIPQELIYKIFDPFFSTKPVGKGVGLGLAICYDIITGKHHGSLLCQSPPQGNNPGSQFTIVIPIAHTPLPDLTSPLLSKTSL